MSHELVVLSTDLVAVGAVKNDLFLPVWDLGPVFLLTLIGAKPILSAPDGLDNNLVTHVLQVEVIIVLVDKETASALVLLELVVE